MAHRFGGTIRMFIERVAKQNDSVTGQRYDGLPRYNPPLFSNGKPVGDQEYEFQLITFKPIQATQGRTPNAYWAQSIEPENFVLMHKRDAQRLKVNDGDMVKLVSSSNPTGVFDLGNGRRRLLAGKVKAIEGIRPGVVAVSQSYGHWGYGAADIEVDGEKIRGDPRRGKGLQS